MRPAATTTSGTEVLPSYESGGTVLVRFVPVFWGRSPAVLRLRYKWLGRADLLKCREKRTWCKQVR